MNQRFQFVQKLCVTGLLVWSCCYNLLCHSWHIKAKTIMTGAEFQPNTHPLTDKMWLSHKCNLRTCRYVSFIPHTHTETRSLSLRSEIYSHCSVKKIQMVGELNTTTFITPSNGSFKRHSSPTVPLTPRAASAHHRGRQSSPRLVITSTV